MAATKVMLPCGHCSGTGREEAVKLTVTLAAVHATRWRSTQLIARTLLVGETNMANRMAKLLSLGLVERRGAGANMSPYEWRLK